MSFEKLLGLSMALIIGLCTTGCAAESDHFGIYSSRLDGSQVKLLIADPHREMNHARVSPDGKVITFTRYNEFGANGFASEDRGYAKTEIMLLNSDGSGLQTLVPGKPGICNGNGNFSADGKSVIFVSSDNQSRQGRICKIDLQTDKISEITPTPAISGCSNQADPHVVKDKIVFTAQVRSHSLPLNQLWVMNIDGSGASQLTDPVDCLKKASGVEPIAGDFDPKLSPDASKVASMRHIDKDQFDVIVINRQSRIETDLSQAHLHPQSADAVPEWSSDSKLLVFWHTDRRHVHDCGLWTMTPTGEKRSTIDLPRGYFYSMPAFFPGTGSGADSRIIFSGKRQPGL
jgi:Tol biopolymer transport system component